MLIVATFVVTIYAIFMRCVMNKPLLWADEITCWALVAIVMLEAAEAYRRGDHIAIDLISARTTGLRKRIINFVADVAVLAFAVIVAISTWEALMIIGLVVLLMAPGLATWLPYSAGFGR